MLDVSDNLERALEAVKPAQLAANQELKVFFDGVEMTCKMMAKVLESNDVKQFNPLGHKFNPNIHQALQEVVDPSKEPGTVCYVMKTGYQLKDRLLRPASVAVVKEAPKTEPEGEKKEESTNAAK